MNKKRKLDLQQFAEKKMFMDVAIDFKASADEKGVIEGYASTFGNIDRGGDIVEKGAFQGSRSKIPIFGMHDPRQGIGTGRVSEDEKGLFIKIKLEVDNEDSDVLRERAKEYYAMAKAGIIERMSIGYLPLDYEWLTKKVSGKEIYVRSLKKIDLLETSLVPIPMNDKARITTVKAHPDADDDEMDFKQLKQQNEALEKRLEELEQKLQDLQQKPNNEPKTKALTFDAIIAHRLRSF